MSPWASRRRLDQVPEAGACLLLGRRSKGGPLFRVARACPRRRAALSPEDNAQAFRPRQRRCVPRRTQPTGLIPAPGGLRYAASGRVGHGAAEPSDALGGVAGGPLPKLPSVHRRRPSNSRTRRARTFSHPKAPGVPGRRWRVGHRSGGAFSRSRSKAGCQPRAGGTGRPALGRQAICLGPAPVIEPAERRLEAGWTSAVISGSAIMVRETRSAVAGLAIVPMMSAIARNSKPSKIARPRSARSW